MNAPLRISLLAVAIAAAYAPLLIEFGQGLWQKPHYQHFPFILLAAALLFVRDLMEAPEIGSESAGAPPNERAQRRWPAAAACIAAWLVLLLAYRTTSPLLGAVSFIVLLGGVGYSVAGRLGRPFPVGPWMLLWLLIPPPLGLDNRLIESLQRGSSQLSSRALDLLGVDHLMDGNTLLLPDKQLFVDEACSGIVSVISIVACAALYGVWRRRVAAHTLMLMAAAAGWATLLNVVRITAIALAHAWGGIDLSEGLPHTLVGVATFGLSCLTLVATDWLLRALVTEVGPRWDKLTGEELRFGAPLVRLWDAVIGNADAEPEIAPQPLAWSEAIDDDSTGHGAVRYTLITAVAFAAVAALQWSQPAIAERPAVSFPDTSALAQQLQQSVMPDSLAGLSLTDVRHEQRSESNVFGEHSVIFTYAGENGAAYQVSCDFPFVGGWHELSVCYRGIGWRVDDWQAMESASGTQGDADAYEFAQIEMTKPDGSEALVTFCACYDTGEAVEAPEVGFWNNLAAALTGSRNAININRRSFQVQVLAVRNEALTEADRETSRELLEGARQRFIEAIEAGKPSPFS